MRKTLFTAMGTLLFGASACLAVAAAPSQTSSQPVQPETAGPGMMRMAQPENRLARLSTILGLTDEQKAKIGPILEDESTKVKSVLDDSTLTRQQRRIKIREIHAETFESIKPLLTQEQLKKHEEIMKPRKGMGPKLRYMTPDKRMRRLSSLLNLSEEQKAKIRPVLEQESAKIKPVLEDPDLSAEQKRAEIREIHAETFESIKQVLTPEQLKKHEEMMKRGRYGL